MQAISALDGPKMHCACAGYARVKSKRILTQRNLVRLTWAFKKDFEAHVCIQYRLQLCTRYEAIIHNILQRCSSVSPLCEHAYHIGLRRSRIPKRAAISYATKTRLPSELHICVPPCRQDPLRQFRTSTVCLPGGLPAHLCIAS